MEWLNYLLAKYKLTRWDERNQYKYKLTLTAIVENPLFTYDMLEKHKHILSYQQKIIACNPNFANIDYIISTIKEDWDWNRVSYHLSIYDILNNQDLPIPIDIEFYYNIPIDTIIKLKTIENKLIDQLWPMICRFSKTITFSDIINNPDVNWDYSGLLRNYCFDKYKIYTFHNHKLDCEYSDELKKHTKLWANIESYIIDPYTKESYYNWDDISKHENLTYETIINICNSCWYPVPFNWKLIYLNKNIDKSLYLNSNPSRYIDFNVISQVVNLEDVLTYDDINWNWYAISLNQNIKLETITKHLNLKWNWYAISIRSDLTIDFIRKYQTLLDWKQLSKNDNTTLDMIINNLDLAWNYKYLSQNINITPEFVMSNPDKDWDLHRLSKYIGTYESTIYKNKIIRAICIEIYCIKEIKYIVCEYV
jgi:hypothetical protein